MGRPAPLSAVELTDALGARHLWSGDTTGIRRTCTAPDFPTGIALVSAVAVIAEELDHHPDIDIRWRSVTFFLVTHDAGGVTALDLELAGRIDEVASALSAT